MYGVLTVFVEMFFGEDKNIVFFVFFSEIGLLAVYPNKEQDNYQNQRAQLEQ